MVNLIVGAFSQSGSKEFQKGDIGTSRAKTVLQDGQIIEDGLKLENLEQIESWVLKNFHYILQEQESEINITMHAMAMSKILLNYPKLLINALKNQIDILDIHNSKTKEEILKNRIKINVLLISFNQKASEDNLEGTHIFYPVRGIKNDIENSLITCDVDRKKIIDLEVFDSSSSKILGFTFFGVVGQFIEFLESDKNHPISLRIREKLKIFLGNDYDKIIEFLSKYPFNGKLKEGQLSMRELGEKGELDVIINKLASNINFGKLSYISGIISDLYIELAMKDLRENKEEILNMDGKRFLLNWNRIKNIYDSNINKLDLLEFKLENKNIDGDLEKIGIFIIINRSDDGNLIECKFNPTEENFDIIGNNEKGGHFGVIPLIMLNGLIYDSKLLKEEDGEYISETRPGSAIYLGNEILITKEDDIIIVRNKYNKNEIFSTIQIQKRNNIDEIIIDKGLLLRKDYNEYDETLLPHGNRWIDIFSNNTLCEVPFGFNIDFKALIIESIGIKLARNYFLNPNERSLNSLKNLYPKLQNLSQIKGVFSKVTSKFYKNFEEKIKDNEFDILVINAKIRGRFVMFDVCVIIGNEIISEHSLTIY